MDDRFVVAVEAAKGSALRTAPRRAPASDLARAIATSSRWLADGSGRVAFKAVMMAALLRLTIIG